MCPPAEHIQYMSTIQYLVKQPYIHTYILLLLLLIEKFITPGQRGTRGGWPTSPPGSATGHASPSHMLVISLSLLLLMLLIAEVGAMGMIGLS